MPDSHKVLLVGWDAADWKMIHPLMDAGLMPNVQKLVEEGVMAKLHTLSPVFSPMLWTSIATGKRPYKHGIYGFTEPTPDGKAVQPVTNLSRKTKAVWNILQQNDLRSLVIGWWPSHPAEPIDGVMVSNHYQRAPKSTDRNWQMAPGTVHPPELEEELSEIRFHPLDIKEEHIRPFVPNAHEVDQDKDRRLDSLARMIADATTIQNCATHLLQVEEWDFAAVYFDAIDHFGHGFMKYHPPQQKFVSDQDFHLYQNVVAAGYVYHDMMLGHLMAHAGEEATVILMSDHGFHPDHLRPQAMPNEPAGPAVEHRDLGILAIRGPGIKRDEMIHGANLLDITPTILTLFGLPVGKDMDGRPLKDIFTEKVKLETIPSWDEVQGDDGRHPADKAMDANEAREQLDQLVALGYIEKPQGNMEENVRRTQRELDYNLGMAYMDGNLYGEAAPIFARLYRNDPLEFRFGVKLGLCLHAVGAYSDLKRLTPNLRALWQRSAERAKVRLLDIREIGKQRRSTLGLSDQDEAKSDKQIFNENERRAIKGIRAMAKGDPYIIDYLDSLVAIATEDHETALRLLSQTADSQNQSPGFFLQTGNAQLNLGNLAEAQRSFDRALELDSDNPQAYLGKARCFLKEENYPMAAEAALSAISLKYQFPPAHFFYAKALTGLGRPQEAIESLNLAIEQNPNFPEAFVALAEIMKELKQPILVEQYEKRAQQLKKLQRQKEDVSIVGELPSMSDDEIDAALPNLPPSPMAHMDTPLAVKPDAAQKPAPDAPYVTIVSGLPRSGTSMMMQMLAAGGAAIMQDDLREADENNPRGYLEYDPVKRLNQDNQWLGEASGKALKVVSPLLPYLPQKVAYRVIVMERDPAEIVASQRSMLDRLKTEGGKLNDEQIIKFAQQQIAQGRAMLAAHGVATLYVQFQEAIDNPAAVSQQVNAFLGGHLDESAMAAASDASLHRERSPSKAK
ncbi:alkaline phosphatase family protein [Cerasicoccus frondis]|uniref:alkaline phosphatase family protein n=1 Tax=Cerasicoccus frondis TaxID=490090 RepID=UPI002852A92F|nr:alkaline phosphatase family protein [Cerasicoccus frondis]